MPRLSQDSFDPFAPIIRKGRTEYIRLRSGELRSVRSWNPVRNRFVLTALGKVFFGERSYPVIIELPVILEGHRSDGTEYNMRSWFPVQIANTGLSEMSLEQRRERIHAHVLALFPNTVDGRRVIAYYPPVRPGDPIDSDWPDEIDETDETVWLDETRLWREYLRSATKPEALSIREIS